VCSNIFSSWGQKKKAVKVRGKNRSMVAASRKQPVVINFVDDEDVGSQTKVYGGGILPEVSQINTEPLPGKIRP
jgi:hypothetical protein